jgi:hypothetical protein
VLRFLPITTGSADCMNLICAVRSALSRYHEGINGPHCVMTARRGGEARVLSDLSWIFDGAGTAAVAALSGMGARAAVRYWKPQYSCRARTTVYTADPESHMADYRARLDEVVAAARHNVYFSGPGFGPSSKGEKVALTCVAAIRSALQRGIRVVRVQTTPHAHEF